MSASPARTDQEVLDLIRFQGPLSVSEFVEHLGVTATAVRQRLNRLIAADLVDRVVSRHGRGRPVHKYSLTDKGVESIGDNLADFAIAMWSEVQEIDDATVRQKVIQGVVSRLAERYAEQIQGESLEERLESIAKFFADRNIPFVMETVDGHPTLKIVGCPYPELASKSSEICDLEQRVLSELSSVPLAVDRCQCDSGGQCCTFQSEEHLQETKPNELQKKD